MSERYKEKRLQRLLYQFCLETEEGEWIAPLNPANIEICFTDLYRNDESMLFGDVVYLDPDHEATHLFPYYIKELWLIKQKREHCVKYYLNRVFNLGSMDEDAEKKYQIAFNWIRGDK